ncbi:MAG: hypothetical protein AAB617_00120 [Patescibacteria group bacterium]
MVRKTTIGIIGSIPSIVKNDGGLYEGDLRSYFRAVFHHAKNLTHPYHNFRYVCHVMWLCYQACIYYIDKLTPRQMRNLLIAGLFHDFNHTGEGGLDSVNIARALEGLREHLAPEDVDHFEDIAAIIRWTEFPYKTPSEEIGLLGQIVRDADRSQAMSTAWIQQVIIGLSEEWHRSRFEVLKMQEGFHASLKFTTDWAKEMFTQNDIDAKIAEARELVAILEEEPVAATA